MKEKIIPGPTPAGGVRAVLYFTADDGTPVDEDEAERVIIVEQDKAGVIIATTYGETNTKAALIADIIDDVVPE